MQATRRKNIDNGLFQQSIVYGTHLVTNPIQIKVQENVAKKSSKKPQDIPSYSQKKFKEIQLFISNLKSVEFNKSLMAQCVQSVICLMCWIWQQESFQYKTQKYVKKSKKNLQSEEQIDSTRCIRKLFQLFNKNNEIFAQCIFLNRDIVQRNGIKTKMMKNQQKAQKSSKINTQNSLTESQQSKQQIEVTTVKNYYIYQVYKNLQLFRKNDQKVTLLTLLLEITVFSYDLIVLLDINLAASVIFHFAVVNSKNTEPNQIGLHTKILEELTIFTFQQLGYLKTCRAINHQNINVINKKKASQEILWKFFANLTKTLHQKLCTNKFHYFHLKNLEILKTAHILVSQFTNYMKKNTTQIKQIKIIDLELFLQIFIERIIQVQFYLFEIKQRKQQNVNHLKNEEIFNYKFQLFVFDWALLVVKNDKDNFFKKILKFCKKKLFRSLEQNNFDHKESLSNNYPTNKLYNNFVIKQDPYEFSQGKSRSEGKQFLNRQSEGQVNGIFKMDHKKAKAFVSVPHMKLLKFDQVVPLSAKRVQDKKSSSKKESVEDSLIFLLILYNREYIMQLLHEIQFIETQQLDPSIAKGLVKLCAYCNKFTSLILIERYLKVLASIPYQQNLLQSVFQKDIDHKRRISQSRLSYHSSNKSNISSDFQSFNEQDFKIPEKNDTSKQQEILKVRLSSCQAIFFQMITEIQSKLPLLKLSSYMDEALKKPQIFRAQIFYQKLLQFQHACYGRAYLSQLIIRWIDHQLRFFNILSYFDIFFKNCLFSEEQQGQLSLLIQQLPISKLIKLHTLLLTETFAQQTSIKLSIPDTVLYHEKMQSITSGGYQQKAKFIDKQFNGMPQIILWDKYLKLLAPLQKHEKYLFIKSYFSLILFSFLVKENWIKNQQKLLFLIERLKIDIQKDKVDEVCSIFHFLSLALLPNKSLNSLNQIQGVDKSEGKNSLLKMRVQQNSKQKIIDQIFHIIRQNSRKLIEMFRNKQSLTIKYLTDDIRRKTVGDVNSDIEEAKRKQVAKMLNRQKIMHDYLIKTIIRFVQNVDYSESFLRNFHSPQQFIDIIGNICKREYLNSEQKIFQTQKVLFTPRLNYYLSTVSSSNQFQINFRKEYRRFEQNSDKHHNRYIFLAMVSFIAQKWIQQKQISLKSSVLSKEQNKISKGSKSYVIENKSKQKLDSKSKNKNSSITNLISIQNIFKICFSVLEIKFTQSVIIRESQILKQKNICLESLYLLSNFIISNSNYLKTQNSPIFHQYAKNYHFKLSQILISILTNNEQILGKNQKELILHLRLQALSHVIENYAHNSQYDEYEWRLIKDRKSFWFLINCLIFEKAVQLRFFIIKNCLSRFSISPGFRSAMTQKLIIFQLLIIEQPVKLLSQLAKKSLNQIFQYVLNVNQNKGFDLILNSLMGCIEFVVNFNLVNYLQKDEKRINVKQFFQILIQTLFQKNEIEAYFFALIQSFKVLINGKSINQLLKLIEPLDWQFPLNIDFYIAPKGRPNRFSFTNKQNQQSKKMYLELIQQLQLQNSQKSFDEKVTNKSEKKSKKNIKKGNKRIQQLQIKFFELLLQTLKVIEQAFKLKCAKINKKYLKMKKPLHRIFDTPIVPNFSSFINQTFERQQKSSSGKHLRQSQEEIQI